MVEVAQISNGLVTLASIAETSMNGTARASLSQPSITVPKPPRDRPLDRSAELTDLLDRSLHAAVARFTGGLSPAALSEAYLDWANHLANAPGKRLRLTEKATRKAMRFGRYAYQYA